MTVLASGSSADMTSTEAPGLTSSLAFLISIEHFVCVGHYSHYLTELSQLCKVDTIFMPIFTDKKTEAKRDQISRP